MLNDLGKKEQRDRIKKDTERFLRDGGKIESVPFGRRAKRLGKKAVIRMESRDDEMDREVSDDSTSMS